MKNTLAVFALLALTAAACDRTPLGHRTSTVVSDGASATAVGTSSVTATKIDTASTTQTATGTSTAATATATSTATAPITVTTVVTATTTETATATVTAELVIDFSMAFHHDSTFDMMPGQKNLSFGSFLAYIKGASKVTVKELPVGFNYSTSPRSDGAYTAGANNPALVSNHITDCVFRGWDSQVYAGLVDPNKTARADMHDEFAVQTSDPADPFKLELGCDVTPLTVDAEIGFAIEIMNPEEVRAYDENGKRVKVTLGQLNGNPPQLAGILKVTNNCQVGTTVDIGNGIAPSIAGSNSGFGIVWKDNTFMPKEMDKVMFGLVDAAGKQTKVDWNVTAADVSELATGISATPNDYVVQFDTNLYSNFSYAGFDGTQQGVLFNQSIVKMIVGTNYAFGFMNGSNIAPMLKKFSLGANSLISENEYQWGPSSQSSFTTTKGAQAGTGSTWAFGMAQDGQVQIIVVQNDGVYPNVVNPVDNTTGDFVSLDGIVLDSIVATDIGFVMAWWYEAAGQNYIHYLSFVPFNGMSYGVVTQTVEVMGWTGSNSPNRHDRLAWNGKYIGLLAANPVVGETDLFMFRNNGTQVGDAVSIFTNDTNRKNYDAADLAASGSAFGIVSTSSTGTKAQFTPVTCQ